MNISIMRRNLTLKKKINFISLLIILGFVIFGLSMIAFVINACTIQKIAFAWIMLALIFLGSGMLLVGLILLLFKNKDKIKEYLDKIIN